VVTGVIYLLVGIVSGHLRRDLLPRRGELTRRELRDDIAAHLGRRQRPVPGGLPYGLLQKCTYCGVVFLGLPLMALTGWAMSPAMSAAYPFLAEIFGGTQSARTIHFCVFVALLLFFVAHLLMVGLSGFKRQMRAMTLGGHT
jgi:thiosulfate reductase cytochrome b subunit